MIYTDTDSFIFGLLCDDVYEELSKAPLCDYIDFSNFNPEHRLYDDSRKGFLGLLKSETGSKLIEKVRALKSKMYYVKIMNDDAHTVRGKGIPKHEQTKLTFEDFNNSLEMHQIKRVTVRNIQQVKGQVSTIKTAKKTLSSFDDKRWMIDRFESRGYGHPDIPHRTAQPQPKRRINQQLPIGTHKNVRVCEIPLEYQSLWERRVKNYSNYFPKPTQPNHNNS